MTRPNVRLRYPEKFVRSDFPSRKLARLLALVGLPLAGGCGWSSLIGDVARHDGGGQGSGGTAGTDAGMALDGPPPTPSPVPDAHAPLTGASKLDLLFMIDDSSSMVPMQQKLAQRLGDFMNILKALPGGLPDVHIAAVSSSLGAGYFANVPGCVPGSAGNLNGEFLRPTNCNAMFTDSQRFIAAGSGTVNYVGDITDLFSCLTQAGQSGCGFEHPFESIRVALQRAASPLDDNTGFLRPDAFLGIVMLTNEDDCSVPVDSMLFDPNQQTLSSPLGGLQSYRCNEFGHLCNGVAPPHDPPATSVTLDDCTSNENGPLVSVEGFARFLKSLKADPSRIFVAALAGPATPYVVTGRSVVLPTGANETQPQIQHSCQSAAGDYADPGIRIAQLLRSFGANGIFETICADDFMAPMRNIGNSMVGMIAP